jgi:integrase/recombinase XerD
LALRDKTNEDLFKLYNDDLVLRLRNPKNLSDTVTMLRHFRGYLGEYPPSPELAKSFLAQYNDRKPRTLYRYTQMIRGFMKWYGEPIDDVRIKVPKTLPPYTEDRDIEKLLAIIPQKRSHKYCIERDQLIVLLAWRTGLRRAELANLLIRDIHDDSLIVRGGKGKKDRMIPLTQDVAARLHSFVENKDPDERVFGLSPESLGMKVKQLAVKAGLNSLHTHTLRHKFATDVLESGTNVKVLQSLLGHENLNTTEIYLSLTDRELYAAANRLDERNNKTTIESRQEKRDSGAQSIRDFHSGVINGSDNDPWIAALRVMLDPANLCRALEPDKVEELQLSKLLVMDQDTVNRLRGFSENNSMT